MQSVSLNLIPGSVLPVVNVSQYDVGRQFQLNVYEGATTYSLTGKTVEIRGTKPDGNGFAYDSSDGALSVSNNVVTISTLEQMTPCAGQVMCELRISSGTTVLGTLNFIMACEPSALADDVPLSETDIPVIERNLEAALAEAEADALVAEGWAKGTQNGTPVSSGTYYQDNAKYYKEQAATSATSAGDEALEAEGWAVGEQNGTPVTSGSPYYQNNAEYYAGRAAASVAQGTQVDFYTQNGHLYVQQTISGQAQTPVDLGPVGGASNLVDLNDVTIVSASDGQLFGYDATAQKWVNVADRLKVDGSNSADDFVLAKNLSIGKGFASRNTHVSIVKDQGNNKSIIITPNNGATLSYIDEAIFLAFKNTTDLLQIYISGYGYKYITPTIVSDSLIEAYFVDDITDAISVSPTNTSIKWVSGAYNGGIAVSGALSYGTKSNALNSGSISLGNFSIADGEYSVSFSMASHAEGFSTTTIAAYSHAEGYNTTITNGGQGAHAEGYSNKPGSSTAGICANGYGSHAEGCALNDGYIYADGYGAHAEGYAQSALYPISATGNGAHAEGRGCQAQGDAAHSEGESTKALNTAAHAQGLWTQALGESSFAGGAYTTADGKCNFAIGHMNKAMTAGGYNDQNGDALAIGNGLQASSAKSNCFRVTYAGAVYGLSAFNSSGADYAEFFEWKDGNEKAEDRVGLFVTLDGDKIKLANEGDYILGIISGQPSVIGNGDEDWLGRWQRDDFGRFIWGDVESENPITGEKETGRTILPNPDYDPEKPYIERKDRQEWDYVGMLGTLAVRDNGKCKVNGFCECGKNGIAVPSDSGYRVISRVSKNVVKVIFK